MTSEPLPDQADIELARKALRSLGGALESDGPVTLTLANGQGIAMPRAAVSALAQILEATAHGDGAAVLPIHAELTTQQAAALLNVSRPYLVGLLEAGQIEFRTVGTHRRVKTPSLIAFMREAYPTRRAAIDELTRETYELGLT